MVGDGPLQILVASVVLATVGSRCGRLVSFCDNGSVPVAVGAHVQKAVVATTNHFRRRDFVRVRVLFTLFIRSVPIDRRRGHVLQIG